MFKIEFKGEELTLQWYTTAGNRCAVFQQLLILCNKPHRRRSNMFHIKSVNITSNIEDLQAGNSFKQLVDYNLFDIFTFSSTFDCHLAHSVM